MSPYTRDIFWQRTLCVLLCFDLTQRTKGFISHPPTNPHPSLHLGHKILSLRLPHALRRKLSQRKESGDGGDIPGMADAFRQLDKLGSLDESVAPVPSKPAGSTARGFSAQSKAIRTPPTEPVTPEKEAQQYTDMVKELESNSNDELYSTVLADMGGRKQRSVAGETENTIPAQGSVDTATSVPPSGADTQAFMDQALAEAMKEVKINNPSMAASILDDKEIMKEIEAIFERGNDKLLQNLEEIRKEQVRQEESGKQNASLLQYHFGSESDCYDSTSLCFLRSKGWLKKVQPKVLRVRWTAIMTKPLV